MDIMRPRPTPAPRMVTTDRSGFQAAFLSAQALGTTGRAVSMGTSITLWIFERVIAGRCPHVVSDLRRIGWHSAARQCTIHEAMKLQEEPGKAAITPRVAVNTLHTRPLFARLSTVMQKLP